ncbi:uncharacterized protein LOC143283917 isoform X2 [Babylonia areolata]|uniref:uncharacterized protein LOC143283917 isoform X2 n=1 Tax=Babylonia areolata TaxID=304850 RepID=UPI003FD1018E
MILAVQEILKDLKRGAERAKEHGALGWQKNPAPPPNKRFLRNMLLSTLQDDRPFMHRHKLHNTHQPNSIHQDSSPRKPTDSRSDTYFRYKDKYCKRKKDNPHNGRKTSDSKTSFQYHVKYHQKRDSMPNGSGQRTDWCSDLSDHRGYLFYKESEHSDKRQASSPQTARKDIHNSDTSEKEQDCRKRSRISISDLDVEKVEDRKKQKRKHHRQTDEKDDRHLHQKRKHKKSKKSKKRKS